MGEKEIPKILREACRLYAISCCVNLGGWEQEENLHHADMPLLLKRDFQCMPDSHNDNLISTYTETMSFFYYYYFLIHV